MPWAGEGVTAEKGHFNFKPSTQEGHSRPACLCLQYFLGFCCIEDIARYLEASICTDVTDRCSYIDNQKCNVEVAVAWAYIIV